MCSGKATVNTVLIILGALTVFGLSVFSFIGITSIVFDALEMFFGLWLDAEKHEVILSLIIVVIWLLVLLFWLISPLLLLAYFFQRPQEIHLYSNKIYIGSVGEIPLNKITSYDTPIFDYPDGDMPRLHIRRKWRLPLRLAAISEQESFRRLTYQFVENIQKLPEHERPTFKTIHGSVVARLFGVALLVVAAITTLLALKLGRIPGMLILVWSTIIPISLLFIKGQRTP